MPRRPAGGWSGQARLRPPRLPPVRPRGIGPLFRVLVCPLDGVNGADGGLAANAVLRALRRREGLGVRVLRGSPTAVVRAGGGLLTLLARTEETGRAWLEREHADALVWGQRAGNIIRLSVVARARCGNPAGADGLHPWATLQLPLPLTRLDAALLHAFVLCAIVPQNRTRRRLHARALARAQRQAETILLTGTAPSGAIVNGYRVALGMIQRAHGLRCGDALRVARAVRLLESGLDALAPVWPRDLLTLARVDWAEAVLALRALGEPPGMALAASRLDTVAAVCQAAAARLPVDGLAETRAAVHATLAEVLRRRGLRDGDADALDAALEALAVPLALWTPARDAARWRRLSAAAGTLLMERAARTPAGAGPRYDEAAAAFGAVLETLDPEADAVAWAHARANLGAALVGGARHGAETGDVDRTRTAAGGAEAALRDALAVYDALSMAEPARLVRRNLSRLQAVRPRLAIAAGNGTVVPFPRRSA